MMRGSRNAKGVEEWSKAGSFVKKPDKGWLHSAQSIKDGGVCYALKYLGCIEVLKSMRTLQYDVRQQVTKEAMYRCCEANGYKFSKRKKGKSNILKLLGDHPRTVHSGTFISLTVSVSGIVLTEMSSGEMISKHDMQGISFASGGEKDCPDIVGYVAKDAKNRRACHVLDCPQSLSYDVINTIGQAFELRYKMFLDDPPQLLPVPRRFEDSIFGSEGQASANASRDLTYDRPRDEPPEDEFADGYYDDDFDDDHEYDSPEQDEDKHEYQKPREPPVRMSKYDTPGSTLETHAGVEYFNLEEPDEKNTSMDFAIGTQFDAAVSGPSVNTPSYNNPLASVATVPNLPTLYDSPGATVNGTGQESKAPFPVNWETFDDEITSSNRPQSSAFPNTAAAVVAPAMKKSSSDPAIPEREESPPHNTLGYALPVLPKKSGAETNGQVVRRTPPPLPKPYARKNSGNTNKPQVEARPQAASPTSAVAATTSAVAAPTSAAAAPTSVAAAPTSVEAAATSGDELFNKVWFHGAMARNEAESLLVRDGDFLVRESTTNPGQYVLTGLQNGYPRHMLLVDPHGVIRTKSQSFDSVGQLVNYHLENRVPIPGLGSAMILRQAVVKNSHSAYDLPV